MNIETIIQEEIERLIGYRTTLAPELYELVNERIVELNRELFSYSYKPYVAAIARNRVRVHGA